MAVEMVRKPSETPNIENVDDFMPIRYAYANQNGYVIGRGRIGTGVDADAYTINGNTFTINSGRLVIQGVECDITTEHSIVIDVSATKRYYAVYLEVNLATNTSDILATYDTLGTPSIDIGEDLTINPVGTARMVLFTFEATNGIITNIVQIVNKCEYSMPYKINDRGVLSIGNIVVPQRKTLWENANGSTSAGWSEELQIGDIVEVTYMIHQSRRTIKGVVYQYSPNSVCCILSAREDWGNLAIGVDKYATAQITVNTTSVGSYIINSNVLSTGDRVTLYKVVKVIE